MTEPQDYVAWLERERDGLELRVSELETQLALAEELLERHDNFASTALESLDEVVTRLTAEEFAPPPRRRPRRTDDAL